MHVHRPASEVPAAVPQRRIRRVRRIFAVAAGPAPSIVRARFTAAVAA